MEIVIAVIVGFLFGYALYNSGAASPKNLVGMLRLENLTLMKIIVFAIGFGSFLLSIFGIFGWFDVSHLGIKTTNLAVIAGGLIFGVGFGAVGTCPGTSAAALGSGGFRKAFAAVSGGLLGAWVFSMTYGLWKKTGIFSVMDLGKLTFFDISDRYPSVFRFGYGGLLVVGIIFMAAAAILPKKAR